MTRSMTDDQQPSPSPDGGGQDNDGFGPWDDSAAWLTLSARDRAEHVAREIRAGRWLTLLRTPVDSDLLDLIAAVRALRSDNTAALAVILRNGNSGSMLITAIKLLAEAADEQNVTDDFLGVWGSYSLVRP